jgi:hypothetical protein
MMNMVIVVQYKYAKFPDLIYGNPDIFSLFDHDHDFGKLRFKTESQSSGIYDDCH